jgi:hypothetical protein
VSCFLLLVYHKAKATADQESPTSRSTSPARGLPCPSTHRAVSGISGLQPQDNVDDPSRGEVHPSRGGGGGGHTNTQRTASNPVGREQQRQQRQQQQQRGRSSRPGSAVGDVFVWEDESTDGMRRSDPRRGSSVNGDVSGRGFSVTQTF